MTTRTEAIIVATELRELINSKEAELRALQKALRLIENTESGIPDGPSADEFYKSYDGEPSGISADDLFGRSIGNQKAREVKDDERLPGTF
jgi:hypothetical protein